MKKGKKYSKDIVFCGVTMQYPSDINDKEWEIIQKFVQSSSKGRKHQISRRSIINAIFYQSKTGCQWQYLPQGFPNYKTVNSYYNKWVRNGTWEAMHNELVTKCRSVLGKKTRVANGRYN